MKTIAFLVATFICGYVIFMVSLVEKQTHWGIKSCELAEISPDFTPQQKQDCRQARKDRT